MTTIHASGPLQRTALITGANNGIGLSLTRMMLSEGWTVIALIRSAFPEDDLLIREAAGKRQLRIYKADLSDFVQLKNALAAIRSQETQIDLLFNNAGGSFPELSFSRQGRELHYELQTVVPYIIMMELKQLILNSPLRTVINTSSNAFMMKRRFDPAALERPAKFRKLTGPYADTKLALSLWTAAVAPELEAEGILIRSADPGGNNTMRGGKKSGIPFWLRPVIRLFFPDPTHGAGLLYQAALGEHSHRSGVFLIKNQVTPLKFTATSKLILEKVQAIYQQEFRPGSSS
ncbi:SDR family NAD(P)-dependent oxidoreductase [Paenibacillus sp. MMS20-IR301]|uniref:SDR family NAD(P)-dependent oxidoreductase n=1 Tax=Paenibacillus sp. MMS20-IR301 TaxID=2895946 RepID=UPI0028E8886D|nr:SDR family NAD(P)-dependent oxidoreductase [Paenibacillus sp. MMS20-IR301]WNS46122.1 SDR family NAD(P)-dependent oxidoreductase [Paenibacillus sp. MMS20-IR301]